MRTLNNESEFHRIMLTTGRLYALYCTGQHIMCIKCRMDGKATPKARIRTQVDCLEKFSKKMSGMLCFASVTLSEPFHDQFSGRQRAYVF